MTNIIKERSSLLKIQGLTSVTNIATWQSFSSHSVGPCQNSFWCQHVSFESQISSSTKAMTKMLPAYLTILKTPLKVLAITKNTGIIV